LTKRNKNLAAFLAIKNDVKEAVAAGYAVKIYGPTWLIPSESHLVLSYEKKFTREPISVTLNKIH